MKATLIIGIIGLIISGFLVFNIKDFVLKILSSAFGLLFIYLITLSNSSLLTNLSFTVQERIILWFLFVFAGLVSLNTFKKTGINHLDKALIIGLCVFMYLGELLVYYLFPVHHDWIINVFLLGRILESISCGLILYLLIKAILYKKNIDELKSMILYIIYLGFEIAHWYEIYPAMT